MLARDFEGAFFLLFVLLATSSARMPVVYIVMGPKQPESFNFLNFELTSRFNDVVVLSDLHISHLLPPNITFVNATEHMKRSHAMKKTYYHISKDNSAGRKHYETLCMIRWLMLQEFMTHKGLDRVFFGDSDNTIFGSTQEFSVGREDCDAMLMITKSDDILGGRVSGHASIWSLKALSDFTDFMLWAYEHRTTSLREIFALHASHHKHISDMSLLWWWTAIHYDKPSWDECENSTLSKDVVFDYVKPKLVSYTAHAAEMRICTGLSPVNGNVFDHMWPWCGRQLYMNFDTSRPAVDYRVPPKGGAYCDKQQLLVSGNKLLQLNNIHFQGGAKHVIVYDLCRYLLRGGDKTILMPANQATCQRELLKHPNGECNAAQRQCFPEADQRGVNLCL
jgi:hypothetical protein